MSLLVSERAARSNVVLDMPAEIHFLARPDDWVITQTDDNGVVTFHWWNAGQNTEMKYVRAFELREAFFAVRTSEELRKFLANSGPFRSDTYSVTWPDFQNWQDYFTRQWKLPKAWGALPERCSEESRNRIIGEPSLRIWPIVRSSGLEQVTLIISCDSVVETIAAVNYLDRRKGASAKTCPGCGKLFVPQTRRQINCSRSCTHTLGERRRRRERNDNHGKT